MLSVNCEHFCGFNEYVSLIKRHLLSALAFSLPFCGGLVENSGADPEHGGDSMGRGTSGLPSWPAAIYLYNTHNA